MSFNNGNLTVRGNFDFDTGVKTSRVRFLGVSKAPTAVQVNGKAIGATQFSHDVVTQVLDVSVGLALTGGFTVGFS